MHVSGGREAEPGQDLEECGLASPVGADEPVQRTGGHLEVDPGERLRRAVRLAQPNGDDGGGQCDLPMVRYTIPAQGDTTKHSNAQAQRGRQ